jgi:hypothetical protein
MVESNNCFDCMGYNIKLFICEDCKELFCIECMSRVDNELCIECLPSHWFK